jgi:hypothetical protein
VAQFIVSPSFTVDTTRPSPALQLDRLASLVSAASRYFAPGAAAEISALLTPSLSNVHAASSFTAQACLVLLLPSSTRVEDLPPGTLQHWLRLWSLVDDCSQLDVAWAALFARFAHPARIGSSAGFDWAAVLPLLFTRLQGALSLEVAGRKVRQVRRRMG